RLHADLRRRDAPPRARGRDVELPRPRSRARPAAGALARAGAEGPDRPLHLTGSGGSMVADTVETVPLYPRRRVVGSPLGGSTSLRRGEGSDIASSRPYQPGDHFRTIDWKASARLSSARGSDEFIVRERYAEQMPR